MPRAALDQWHAAQVDQSQTGGNSLVPIRWSTGVGSDIMKPIAAPIVGGMITSTIHVLIITPVIFYIMKVRALRKGRLQVSGMAL
jgi:Cu(I)/Ag(I) efflux system membrane protein CusA/SilA